MPIFARPIKSFITDSLQSARSQPLRFPHHVPPLKTVPASSASTSTVGLALQNGSVIGGLFARVTA